MSDDATPTPKSPLNGLKLTLLAPLSGDEAPVSAAPVTNAHLTFQVKDSSSPQQTTMTCRWPAGSRRHSKPKT